MRRMGSCPCKQTGRSIARFHPNPSGERLAAYERYREASMQDADCQAAFRYAEETGCIVSYERSFFRPVFA